MERKEISFGTKRGQVAIFVIIALLIVGGIIIYFVARDKGGDGKALSGGNEDVFDYYLSCLERETKAAIQIAGEQGGRIDSGLYAPGSEYAPFSSHLNFLGTPVPYWYYMSGNGLIKENVPSKQEIQKEIGTYIIEGTKYCDFEIFNSLGYSVSFGEPGNINVVINDDNVEVTLDQEIISSKNNETSRKSTHSFIVDSNLGKFYDLSRELYSKQKSEAFLERYAADVLYLYAPVDGVEVQCGPKVWSSQKVMGDLRTALEQNFAFIRFEGDYYTPKDKDKKYFVVDQKVDETVNIMYSQNWPTKIEVSGDKTDNEVMIAEPIGTQEGLGAMGFCYVPYHFVYDMAFPVMIQIYNEEELFQFPVVVVIDKNVPRNSLATENPLLGQDNDFDLCANPTQQIQVNLYDFNLNPVNANLSYECFQQRCRLGATRDGRFSGLAPACVNGYIQVQSEGYSEKKQLFSSNRETSADILLEREFSVPIKINMAGSELGNSSMALVSFVRDDGKAYSASLPLVNEIKLTEGNYEVKVHVYGNTSINIPASTKTQCVDVPREGLLGIFGGKKEKCFDINVPETKMDYGLIGGGSSNNYILESDLQKGGLVLSVSAFKKPGSIQDLQTNFESLEVNRINFEFKNVL